MGWLDSRHSTSRRDYLRDRVSQRAAGETSVGTRTRRYLILLVGIAEVNPRERPGNHGACW